MVGSFTAWIVFLFLACVVCFFFFSSRRRHTRFDCDWSSDVCSSDLMIRHTRFDCDWSSDVCSSDLYDTVLRITREIYQAGKPLAFICHAGWVPISAKILKGKRATSVRAIKDDMENAGVIWEDAPVVVDGNLISSRTPADLPAFCKALIAALRKGPVD